LACDEFARIPQLLRLLDSRLSGTLTAFEVMWNDYYSLVARDRQPLADGFSYYVLVEAQGNDSQRDSDRFLSAVEHALTEGLAADAMIAQSGRERNELWAIRESVELTLEDGPAMIFDVGLPLSAMESYLAEVRRQLRDEWGSAHRLSVFGHAGDGNLHLVVAAGDGTSAAQLRIERCVYEPLADAGGTVSAEHGIGLEKKQWLSICRNPAEIAVMRKLKAALDPRGILNHGRIFSADDEP
ncbi:MAG: FAD-binding oxidoreductase, partial [Gammaproteobacteria bacterium]|nr:FAD-binding oxidoreductase [Gammaproteobacteria bacterium]